GGRVAPAGCPAGALPDPDMEISTIRLHRGYVSRSSAPDRHHDPGAGERIHPEHLQEPLPRQSRPLAATAQPLAPRPPGVPQQAGQTLEVPIDPEVVGVALPATAERGVLHLQLLVPMAAAPGVDGLDRPSQARTSRLARQTPTTTPGP